MENGGANGVQVLVPHQQTPKKNSAMIDSEKMLDKINQLTTKPDNCVGHTKVPTIKDFVIIKPISRGAFGKVFLGYKNTDHNKLFAIKVMRKSEMINKNMVSQVITERNALALSRSPFCVNLFYSLQSTSYVYLVMEYMVGGDLKSLLAMYGYFDESAARFYVAEVTLALQYLHTHGIVHRDIKPDNMLLSATGHVKLTDFGLSKIEMRRADLEISDLINCSPHLNSRTPGQLLSLTSHLSFGSEKKFEYGTGVSNFINVINKHGHLIESSDSEADTSLNEGEKTSDSKISGVSPFFSAEELNISLTQLCQYAGSGNCVDSSGLSYHTCGSSDVSKFSPDVLKCQELCEKNNNNNNNNVTDAKLLYCKGCLCDKTCNNKNLLKLDNNDDTMLEFSMIKRRSTDERFLLCSKTQEDSGVSCRKSDFSSSQLNSEITTSLIDKGDMCTSKDEFSCSDYSKSFNHNNQTNEMIGMRNNSSIRNVTRNFKKPEVLSNSMKSLKRKMNMIRRSDTSSSSEVLTYGSTGLTQEIDIMDIGSSTPKKRRAKSPIRGVLKVRSLSDDELPHIIVTADVANVVFSTPVSSQKVSKRDNGLLGKLKATRFNLPMCIENKKCEVAVEKTTPGVQYLKMVHEDPAMSPINLEANVLPKTPKNVNTPYRTPKSVRRGAQRQSSEKILGTPDYLAPELLTKQGHGPAVDWWALGVCFYEFLTGIPPFNDETPHKVFENILNKNIEWPEGEEALSAEAVEAVDLMLTMNPLDRPAAKEVQQMPFFASIQWNNMENEEPPFVPSPDDPTDTVYFEARNNLQHLKLSNFVFED